VIVGNQAPTGTVVTPELLAGLHPRTWGGTVVLVGVVSLNLAENTVTPDLPAVLVLWTTTAMDTHRTGNPRLNMGMVARHMGHHTVFLLTTSPHTVAGVGTPRTGCQVKILAVTPRTQFRGMTPHTRFQEMILAAIRPNTRMVFRPLVLWLSRHPLTSIPPPLSLAWHRLCPPDTSQFPKWGITATTLRAKNLTTGMRRTHLLWSRLVNILGIPLCRLGRIPWYKHEG
jgi:hypothetical protein